jgi:glyoxylase-like metal-dependent hydrolase (beta-lactamase superfamily II)
MRRVSEHVCILPPDATTDRPILGAISGANGTLMVDAGNSPAHVDLFLRGAARVGLPPLRYLVITHWHWDHVFGAQALDLPTLASVETRRIVTEMTSLQWDDASLDARVAQGAEIAFCRDMMRLEWPNRSALAIRPPNIGIRAAVEIDLGGVICDVVPVGGDHSSDSTVVYARDDKVLFLGDCLGPDLYSGDPSYTTRALFPLLDRLLGFHAELYVEAHEPEPMTRSQMRDYAALLRVIGQAVDGAGPQRETALAAVREALGADLNDEQIELTDAFLAGLRKDRR